MQNGRVALQQICILEQACSHWGGAVWVLYQRGELETMIRAVVYLLSKSADAVTLLIIIVDTFILNFFSKVPLLLPRSKSYIT